MIEEINQKIKKIKFNHCERQPDHGENQMNMICVDHDCIGNGDRYQSLMCALCVEENIHQKQNHIQKPFQKVITDLMKGLERKKQESDRIQQKFVEINEFIHDLKATILDESLIKKVNSIFQHLSSQISSPDHKFMEDLIKITHEIEYNEETHEISIKNNNLNQSVDSDTDRNVAHELYKDFVKLIDIFKQNNHQFDQNIIIPLQGYSLLNHVKETPLGKSKNKLIQNFDKFIFILPYILQILTMALEKERLFKDAFRLESTQSTDNKRPSIGSRRQSLEMFEADKKILLLMNENDRLNFSLNAKQDEIDILKIKLSRAEDELKKQNDKNPEEEEDNPQVKILQFELERVNKALEYKNKEIEQLYQKNSSKIQENGETIIELQGQIDMLIKENERLNCVIMAKDQELVTIQSINNLEDKSLEGYKTEVLRLNKLLGEMNAKFESIQNENSKTVDSKNEEIKHQNEQYNAIQQKHSQFGQQIDKLSKEVERLNLEIQQKTSEIELWKNKIPKEIPKEQIITTTTNYVPISQPNSSNTLTSHYNSLNHQLSNNINPSKLLNNYGISFQASQLSSQGYLNRDRLSEGQSLITKLDQVKSASHIKKISAFDKIDIYKKNEYLQQPLSSRFKSPPISANLIQTTVSMTDYDMQNKSLITPIMNKNQINTYHIGSNNVTLDRKTSAPSNNISSDEKISSLSSSINYYKAYKHNSQFSSPQTQIQSIIPYKERIDNKIQNLSKEIGKLNNILDNRDQPEKKPIQQLHSNLIKQQTYRSGSEGLKNKIFK